VKNDKIETSEENDGRKEMRKEESVSNLSVVLIPIS